jgi:sulfatase maturation enzyme AslB (radical SAM superfamily)
LRPNQEKVRSTTQRRGLHTNGVLFDKKAWESLKLENNVVSVIVSVDATKEDTYKAIRRGGDFSRLMTNLEFLGTLRAEGRFDRLALVCVVQRRNYREIPDFVRMAKRFNADQAVFWQIKNWGTFSIGEFLEQAVSFPSHPEYLDLIKILQDPVLHDPIVSLIDLPLSSYS